MAFFKSLHKVIEQAILNKEVIGITMAIVKENSVEEITCHGLTAVENGLPITKDTMFNPGSVAKVFCLLAVLRLVDKGLLDLDRPVVEYLDDFSFSDSIGNKITLSHLLTHSSGLPQSGKYWGPRDENALRRYMYEELVHHQFIADPGEFHEYSNTAICLAGYICEQVTGKYYDDIVQDEVFDPLGMNATFDPIVAMTYPLALHHRRNGERLEIMHKMTRNHAGHPSSFAYCSLQDLINMAQMFLGRGKYKGNQYLSSDLINKAFTPQISRQADYHNHPWATLYQGYTLGLNYGHYRGNRCFRHGGSGLSSDTRFDLFLDDKVAFISFVNYYEGGVLNDIVMDSYDHLLQEFKGDRYQSDVSESNIENDKILGTYHHKSSGRMLSIIRDREGYWLEQNKSKQKLLAKAENEYYYVMEFDPEPLKIPVIFTPAAFGDYIILSGVPYQRIKQVENVEKGELDDYIGFFMDPNNCNPDERIQIRWDNDEEMYQIKEFYHQNFTNIIKIGENEYTSGIGTLNFYQEKNQFRFQLGYSVFFIKYD